MKRTISLLCIIFLMCNLIFSLTSCNPYTVRKEGIIYEKETYYDINRVGHEVYYVAGCYEEVKILNIASEIKGLPVHGFREGAFSNCLHIEEIIIPSSMHKYRYSDNYKPVFGGCNNVKSITVPWGDLGSLFFANSDNLANTNNRLPESLEVVYISGSCSQIDTLDFYHCKTLKEVHIPLSVQTIDDGTTHTYIGVNGHKAPSKFSNLPFLDCNPDLKIYCEATEKPDGWGEYWNHISENQKLTVFWGE